MKTPWADDMGRVARQRRLDMSLSQDELAERVGVSRQWLSRFESAKADVSLSKALLVLRELELEIDVRIPQPSSMPDLPAYATHSVLRTVAKINEHIGESIADSVQRAVRGAGLSETAHAALAKLTLDPNYRQAMQNLQLLKLEPLSIEDDDETIR
jgi:transcriptional regulator with XRE-family HTH domain